MDQSALNSNFTVTKPWLRWCWRGMLVFSFAWIIDDVLDIASGLDPQQNAKFILGGLCSMFISLAFLVTDKVTGWILIAASATTLFINIGLRLF